MIHFDNETISATYGGVAMTLITGSPLTEGVGEYISSFVLANPASGANDVVVTVLTTNDIYSRAASYTGCNQTGQPDAQNTNTSTGTDLSVSVTTGVDNCWLVGLFRGRANLTAGTNTTLRNDVSGFMIGDTNAAQTPTGTYSINATQISNAWGVIGISIDPVGAAAAANHWLLMGV